MKHYIKIKIATTNASLLILKLNKINVDIKNIVYNKDSLILDILASDLKRVKKYLVSSKITIIEETGIYKLQNIFKQNLLFITSIIFALLVFVILNHVIIKVNIVHENFELRNIIKEDLTKYGVTALSFKKSYQEYEKIIKQIKDNHKDKIEWLEIDVKGMVINIRVEERIINNFEEQTGYCHVIANKSGIVKNILTKKGVSLVTINDFVNKGDILISGEIKLNEEVKNDVCASGEVYAEVWYQASASIPLNYELKEDTGKMRYNFMVKKDMTETVLLKSRLSNKRVENKLLFKLFGFEFYFQKEYEEKITKKTYTQEEGLKYAQELIHEKLKIQGSQIDKIINEKVLQKNVNNDNLNIDMFIATLEEIGTTKSYTKETSDTSDIENNKDHNGIS